MSVSLPNILFQKKIFIPITFSSYVPPLQDGGKPQAHDPAACCPLGPVLQGTPASPAALAAVPSDSPRRRHEVFSHGFLFGVDGVKVWRGTCCFWHGRPISGASSGGHITKESGPFFEDLPLQQIYNKTTVISIAMLLC